MTQFECLFFQSKDLQLDIIPASAPGSDVKLRDAAHELNEEKRKSARRKEYVSLVLKQFNMVLMLLICV